MNERNPFTRREFLQTGLVMASTAATVPLFIQQSAFALDEQNAAAGPGKSGVGDNILVVIQLTGGNDGLNTVVPFGMSEYYAARPQLGIPKEQVLVVDKDAGIGLHPDLADMKSLYDDGVLGIVQGVGYPNPNRSHFSSMDIWHTADPNGGKGLGWLGKALDQVAVKTDAKGGTSSEPTACVCIGHDSPLATQGKVVKPIAFERANLFRWVGADTNRTLGRVYDQMNRGDATAAAMVSEAASSTTQPDTNDNSQAAFVTRTALDAQIASDRIRAAVERGPITSFPQNPLAQQLRMVCAMIRAGLPTRVYYVSLGGFDTHAGQAPRQSQLFRQLASSVKAFQAELKAMRVSKKVITLSFSEFGRRVAQNASQGTDHGTAGPVFLFGESINPGLLTPHPSLARNKLDQGDLVYGTDFRQVYASILEGWIKADSTKVLGQKFAPAAVLRA